VRFKARIAGVFYLLIIVAALFAEVFVRGRLVVSGNAAATAANILAHKGLYRLGGAADLFTFSCDAVVAFIFYELFRPVSRSLSLFAAAIRLMYVAIVGINTLNHFAPLIFLGGAQFLAAFRTDQLQALALVSLRFHALGYNIGLVFFGFHCLLIGYLILRSTFLPRIIGALMAVAGLCYVTNSFLNFLVPAFAARLFPLILLPGGVSELSLCLWLLVAGVNAQRWKEQVSAGGPLLP